MCAISGTIHFGDEHVDSFSKKKTRFMMNSCIQCNKLKIYFSTVVFLSIHGYKVNKNSVVQKFGTILQEAVLNIILKVGEKAVFKLNCLFFLFLTQKQYIIGKSSWWKVFQSSIKRSLNPWVYQGLLRHHHHWFSVSCKNEFCWFWKKLPHIIIDCFYNTDIYCKNYVTSKWIHCLKKLNNNIIWIRWEYDLAKWINGIHYDCWCFGFLAEGRKKNRKTTLKQLPFSDHNSHPSLFTYVVWKSFLETNQISDFFLIIFLLSGLLKDQRYYIKCMKSS